VRYQHHPRTLQPRQPVKVADQFSGKMNKINARLGLTVTKGVGTMWCAYMFCVIALISLPAAIASGSVIVIISWIAQTFLQLVLLSVIIVGQNIQAAAADKRAESTYEDAEAVLHESLQIQEHLKEQDEKLAALILMHDEGRK